MTELSYAERALRYARAVVAGEVLACKWVKLSCQRFLDDLDRADSEDFAYRFDGDRSAKRICRFIELLPHIKGKWAAKKLKIRLEDWQCFFLCNVFGWVHKQTGLRRFRRAVLFVPRKNAKSTVAAGVGVYGTAADGHYHPETGDWIPEFAPEVFSGATTEHQAFEVFRPAWLMVDRTPDLRQQFDLELGGTWKNPGPIYSNSTLARFEALIGKPGDGASPSMAITDEYWQHDSSAQVDTMQTGMGAREQGLHLVISTGGTDLASPCYALWRELQRVLDGTVVDEQLFGIIYTVDEGVDWTSELALRMANPNYDVSVDGEYLRSQQRGAINDSTKQNTFLVKHLNVWVTAGTAWMNMAWWHRQADSTLSEQQFAGEDGAIAVDLSSKLDLTSVAKGFRRDLPDGAGGKMRPHVYIFGRHYLPDAAATDPAKKHYHGWRHDGLLTVTDGAVIDYDLIEADVLEDGRAHNIRALGYDPWGATQFAQGLQKKGVPVVEIPQNVQQLSDAMKWTEALVKDGCLHHTGDQVQSWGIANIVAKVDKNDNVFPYKETEDGKIDPGVSVIMLVKLLMGLEAPAQSVYEKHAESEWRAFSPGAAEAGGEAPSAPAPGGSIYEQFTKEEWSR